MRGAALVPAGGHLVMLSGWRLKRWLLRDRRHLPAVLTVRWFILGARA